jgi:hypothetical protein
MGSPSHVQDEAHWTAELARKQAPLWLPCTMVIRSAAGVDFLCIARKLADGTLTDPHTWPLYKTQTLPPNELYKIEERYAAWHKAHDDKQKPEPAPPPILRIRIILIY